MPDSPAVSNKAELKSYLKAVNSAYLETIQELNQQYVIFKVDAADMTVRCACPALVDKDGKTTGAEADTNPSSNQQVCEFTFSYKASGLVPKAPAQTP